MNNTTEVNVIPLGDTPLSHGRPGEEGQPKRITTFHLLSVIVITALLAPPLVPGSSIRLDTILILIYPFLLFISNGRIKFCAETRNVVFAFCFLFTGVGLALVLQVFLLGKSYYLGYLHNLQGYTRPLLVALLAAEALRTRASAEVMVKILLAGIVAHGALAIIEFNDLQPFTNTINWLYRGNSYARLGGRALGAFSKVHGLAYFSLYGLLFSLAVILHPDKRPSLVRWAFIAALFSLAALIIPFSRGAWIAAIVASGFMLFYLGRMRIKLLVVITVFSISFLCMMLMPVLTNEIVYVFSSIVEGVQYLVRGVDGATIPRDLKAIGFITARLDWGWMNALEVWKENPLHGDISASFEKFIGDGGYTEALANHGVIGLFGFFLMLLALWKKPRIYNLANFNYDRWFLVSLRAFVIAFLLANLATGILKERSLEILPIMLISLAMLSRRQQK